MSKETEHVLATEAADGEQSYKNAVAWMTSTDIAPRYIWYDLLNTEIDFNHHHVHSTPCKSSTSPCTSFLMHNSLHVLPCRHKLWDADGFNYTQIV